MFIGDRGHGNGSRIKGHMKYGGSWKEKNTGDTHKSLPRTNTIRPEFKRAFSVSENWHIQSK